MPFSIVGVRVDVECRCPRCEHEWTFSTEEVTEYMNNSFGIDEVVCPECGLEFDADTEAEDLDEDGEYS